MSATAQPFQSAPQKTSVPGDSDVQWFGESRRFIGGQADSRYGWLERPDGLYIVKALNPDLTAYAHTLLQHERKMLKRLAEISAPAPLHLDVGRQDWLVTRFAGLSLQRLEHPGGLQGLSPARRSFGFGERLAAWVYLLRRLQPMADMGVIAIDLYDANVVLPLTAQTQGQLRLHEVALIDHAHTVEAGMDMRRPVWLNRDMARIAPELREALGHDQEALVTSFRQAGADLPGYSRLPGERDELSRRVWAEYNTPQQLQQLLDQGTLSSHHAMQFAIGTALLRLLPQSKTPEQYQTMAHVLQRLRAERPADRYPSMADASNALAAVAGKLALVSQHNYQSLKPQDLSMPSADAAPEEMSDAGGDGSVFANELGDAQMDDGPKPDDLPPDDESDSANASATHETAKTQDGEEKAQATGLPMRWLYAGAALGAAAGAAWPW